jgi:hypothetical protein
MNKGGKKKTLNQFDAAYTLWNVFVDAGCGRQWIAAGCVSKKLEPFLVTTSHQNKK